jgi:hypothetical protein
MAIKEKEVKLFAKLFKKKSYMFSLSKLFACMGRGGTSYHSKLFKKHSKLIAL